MPDTRRACLPTRARSAAPGRSACRSQRWPGRRSRRHRSRTSGRQGWRVQRDRTRAGEDRERQRRALAAHHRRGGGGPRRDPGRGPGRVRGLLRGRASGRRGRRRGDDPDHADRRVSLAVASAHMGAAALESLRPPCCGGRAVPRPTRRERGSGCRRAGRCGRIRRWCTASRPAWCPRPRTGRPMCTCADSGWPRARPGRRRRRWRTSSPPERLRSTSASAAWPASTARGYCTR